MIVARTVQRQLKSPTGNDASARGWSPGFEGWLRTQALKSNDPAALGGVCNFSETQISGM